MQTLTFKKNCSDGSTDSKVYRFQPRLSCPAKISVVIMEKETLHDEAYSRNS